MRPTKKFQESLWAKQEQASDTSKPEQNENLNRELIINRINFIIEFAYKRGEQTTKRRTDVFNLKTK